MSKQHNKTAKRPLSKKLITLFFMTGLMSISTAAYGQDYIREVDNYKSDTSIVRVINSTQRLVYNDMYTPPSFIQYTDIGTSGVELQISDDFAIKDFIIDRDTVYFCGLKRTSVYGITQAVVGEFCLTNFPLTTIYYAVVPNLLSFNRMKLYTDASTPAQRRIALTTQVDATHWGMADVLLLPNQYQIAYHASTEAGRVFDDVDATNNYVVFTSRIPETMMGITFMRGEVWRLNKPTTGTQSIVVFPYSQYPFSDYTVTKLLVEPCELDSYAVVYSTTAAYNFRINWFNGITVYSKTAISQSNIKPIELKYNRIRLELEILTQSVYFNTNSGSTAFHVSYGLMNNSGTAPWLRFKYDLLYSLDRNDLLPDDYFASGLSSYSGGLGLFKYNRTMAGFCATMDEDEAITSFFHDDEPPLKSFTMEGTIFSKHIMGTSCANPAISTICN